MNSTTEFGIYTNSTQKPQEPVFDFYIYILPLIVLFGLTGNVISLVTIFHSRLRKVNANIYLIVLTTADSIFLFGILLVCFKIDFLSFEYCVAMEYVLMTSSYVSSWSTAALAIERYLAIAHPLAHIKYGHVDRTKLLLYWVPIPFILQLFQFFSLEPSTSADERKCQLKEANYQIYAQGVDTILCYVVPCCIIVVLNLMVAVKVRKSQQRFEQKDGAVESRRQGGSSSSQSGTWTRILWVMPLVFVVLNTPFYIFMMVEIIFQIIYQSPPSFQNRSELFVIVYNTAHYMYYANTAIDVLVYAFSSANFRKTAIIAWRRIIWPTAGDESKFKAFTDNTSRVSCRLPHDTTHLKHENGDHATRTPLLTPGNKKCIISTRI